MAEINPDVMAQLHRIHVATNDGTFNKDAINDALRVLHDLLSGAAYDTDPTSATEEVAVEEEEHPHKARSHKKKR
jgi:hypothetical protein